MYAEALDKYSPVRLTSEVRNEANRIMREISIARREGAGGKLPRTSLLSQLQLVLGKGQSRYQRQQIAATVVYALFGRSIEINTSLQSAEGRNNGTYENTFLSSDSLETRTEDAATHALLAGTVTEALSQLSTREEEILRHRFMLDRRFLTLKELAFHLDLTHERVRQIEEEALQKLRTGSQGERLRDFL